MKQENKFMTLLKQAWPYIYRGLNIALYGFAKFLKDNVKRAFEQLKS